MKKIHSMALKERDGDGLALVTVHDAGTFAENFNGTDACATAGEDVGVQYLACCAAQVAARDALDETGDVNVRRAGGSAGRVKAVEAAMSFKHCCLWRERWFELGKFCVQPGILRYYS
jgi:hypothetical protein